MRNNPANPFDSEYDGRVLRDCGEFGQMSFLFFESILRDPEHRSLFRRLDEKWDVYWDRMHKAVVEQMRLYNEPNHFGLKPFEIRMNKSGGWIQDEVMFELHFFTSSLPEATMSFQFGW